MTRPVPTPGAVLVIGAGGLGCPAALGLAAGGAARIGVCDDDVVDESNLHRQILHGAGDVGTRKVGSLAGNLGRRFPGVQIVRHDERFDAGSAARLVAAYDVVVDGSDNFATKFLANDASVLAGKPLVHGAAVGLVGQLLTIPRRGPDDAAPCYRCLFEAPPQGGVGPSCAEAGVLGPVPGVVGALLAAEALRLLRGEIPAFAGRLLQYDSGAMSMRTVSFRRNPNCAVCGQPRRINALEPSAYTARGCAP